MTEANVSLGRGAMRDQPQAALCVGGPHDGKWYASETDRLHVAVLERLRSPSWMKPHKNESIGDVRRFTYRLSSLFGLPLWLPEDSFGQNPETILRALMEGYRRPSLPESYYS